MTVALSIRNDRAGGLVLDLRDTADRQQLALFSSDVDREKALFLLRTGRVSLSWVDDRELRAAWAEKRTEGRLAVRRIPSATTDRDHAIEILGVGVDPIPIGTCTFSVAWDLREHVGAEPIP